MSLRRSHRHKNLSRELRAILSIAAPLAAAYMAEMAMLLTDMAIVGRLGKVELAAVGLMADLVWEVILFSSAIVSIVGVFVAQAAGANEHQLIGHNVRQGFWTAVAFSVPGTILCWNLATFLAFTDQDPDVIRLGREYAHTVSGCFLPTMLFLVLREYMAALLHARSVMIITVAAVALNALASYCLVFGVFGLPGLGVAGAGWATTIVCFAMFFALAWQSLRIQELKNHHIFRDLMKVDWRACLRIVRVGGPIGGLALVEGGMFAVVAILMGSFGAEALAANQIVFSIVTLVVVTAVAIGEATGIRIAYGVGGGRPSDARYSGFVGIGLGAVVMVCLSIPYFAFPEILTSLFLNMGDPDNAGVVSFAATLFAVAAFFQVFDGVQAIASRALRGLQDTLVPMWIAAAGYWGIGVLGGYILGFPLGYGGKGLWWGLATGLLAAALMLTWRFTTHSKTLSHTIHKRTYKS